MKRLIPLLIFPLLPLFAQQNTLLPGPYTHGGYGGLLLSVSAINGEPGVLMGGHGGWVVNHALFIGGGGYALVNQIVTPSSTNAEQRYVDFGYGGLELGAIIASNKLVHIRISALVGAGGLSSSRRFNSYQDYHDNDINDSQGTGDAFFMAEPKVELVVNMTKWLRLTAGGSYRFINGIEADSDFSNSDFAGPSAVFSMKFGKF